MSQPSTDQADTITGTQLANMETTGILLENQRWLWTVVYSRLGDRVDTEDVLQEISLAAVKSEYESKGIREVRGWLYQVAIRQVLLFRRNEARNRSKLQRFASVTYSESEADGTADSGLPNTIEEIARIEQGENVRIALASLRPSDRQVLLMKYQEDLSCREIANRFGVTESTIQSRLLRARRKLRGILLKQEYFQDFRS